MLGQTTWNERNPNIDEFQRYQSLIKWNSLCANPLELPSDLNLLLNETSVANVLNQIENEIWMRHFALATRLGRNAESKSEAEQVFWKSGQETADATWPTLHSDYRTHLGYVVSLFTQGGLYKCQPNSGILIVRSTESEVKLQLTHCPHTKGGGREAQDTLCALHRSWIRGFLYQINPRIEVKEINSVEHPCQQHWVLEDRFHARDS